MQKLCKIADCATVDAVQCSVRDIGLVFILECLEWNSRSQLTVCRQRGQPLSQARRITTATVEWTSLRTDAHYWQLSATVVWSEIIDLLLHSRPSGRDTTEKVGHEISSPKLMFIWHHSHKYELTTAKIGKLFTVAHMVNFSIIAVPWEFHCEQREDVTIISVFFITTTENTGTTSSAVLTNCNKNSQNNLGWAVSPPLTEKMPSVKIGYARFTPKTAHLSSAILTPI